MSMLEDAIFLAVCAHKGQTDKAGAPHILHPIRVMLSLDSETERIVGVLHDVVEDSRYTIQDLEKMGYSEEVLQALGALTKRSEEKEHYEAFIERVSRNALALRVKLADLKDNMDVRRLGTLDEREWERLKKYRWAWGRLRGGF
jgi:(p)ppGpp synthase/HD superfamily hydrolase